MQKTLISDQLLEQKDMWHAEFEENSYNWTSRTVSAFGKWGQTHPFHIQVRMDTLMSSSFRTSIQSQQDTQMYLPHILICLPLSATPTLIWTFLSCFYLTFSPSCTACSIKRDCKAQFLLFYLPVQWKEKSKFNNMTGYSSAEAQAQAGALTHYSCLQLTQDPSKKLQWQ